MVAESLNLAIRYHVKMAGAMLSKKTNMTQDERMSLEESMNLTDGHAHRGWSASELSAVQDVLGMADLVSRESLSESERAFIAEVSAISGQVVTQDMQMWLCNSISSRRCPRGGITHDGPVPRVLWHRHREVRNSIERWSRYTTLQYCRCGIDRGLGNEVSQQ